MVGSWAELQPVYILRLQVRLEIHTPSWGPRRATLFQPNDSTTLESHTISSDYMGNSVIWLHPPRRPILFQPNDSNALESHTISSDYMGNSVIWLHPPGGRYFFSQMTQIPLKVTQFPRITWVIQSFDCITRIARRFCNQMNKKVELIKNYIYYFCVCVG